MSLPGGGGNAEEFGDRNVGGGRHTPLAAGYVTGLRIWQPMWIPESFAAAPDGTTMRRPARLVLRSIYRDHHWGPGENLARCLQPPGNHYAKERERDQRVITDDCLENHQHNGQNPPRSEACYRPHLPGMDPRHGCGFYAYTSTGPNSYLHAHHAVHIEGVIEGWGLTTIGSKGFRCSRARIIALVWPPVPPTSHSVSASTVMEECTRERLLAGYPGVVLYDTRKALLADHALGGHGARFVPPETS